MLSEVEISGHTYRIGRLNAKKQFHVARRLAPLLASIKDVVALLPSAALPGQESDPELEAQGFVTAALLAVAGPFAQALSAMTDQDTDYVIDACMEVCQRKNDNGTWAPLRTSAGTMFQDLDMKEMMGVTLNVIQENLGSFFPSAAVPSGASAQNPPQS